MVKTSNGTWRMCVDFTNLNQACPEDFYPLPRIDQLVDSTSGPVMPSFMDAYSGNHQIHKHPANKKKTAFVTRCGVFNYVMMPFGLKNAGATYHRMVARVIESQRGRNLEVYVDKSIVKSVHVVEHVKDLEETFSSLRAFNHSLNPLYNQTPPPPSPPQHIHIPLPPLHTSTSKSTPYSPNSPAF